MSTALPLAEVFSQAHALVARAWTQHHPKMADGSLLPTCDPRQAHFHTSLSALETIVGRELGVGDPAWDAWAETLEQLGEIREDEIPEDWEDLPGRTQADVLTVLALAAELAGSQELEVAR